MSLSHIAPRPIRWGAAVLALAALTSGLLTATPENARAASLGAVDDSVASSQSIAGAGPASAGQSSFAPRGSAARVATASSTKATAAATRPAGVPGFDIYETTGVPNFTAEKAAGARFVYIKASGGVKVTNAKFSEQYNGAKKAGLLVGTYHLAAPNTGSGAAQATWFKNHNGQWHAGGWTLPPMLDLEYNEQQSGVDECYSMSTGQLVSWITQFTSTTSSLLGRAPIIYTSASFWKYCMGQTTALPNNQLFLASYSGSTAPLPASWSTYSFWQYQADGAFPGNQDVFNGTLKALHLLADPAYGSGSKNYRRAHDYSGDGKNDVLSRINPGSIRLYRGTGKGKLSGYSTVASGANAFTALVAPGDMNGDGTPDLYTRSSDGALSFRPGKKGGGFGGAKTVATYMNGMNLFVGVGDFNGDGFSDLLTRDTKGVLWLYIGNNTGGFSPDTTFGANGLATRVQVASGQGSVKQIVGVDNFGSGKSKGIVTSDAEGSVRFYPRTAAGFGTSTVIGTGWTVYNTLVSPGDLTGDGVGDLLARRSNGEVSLYAGTGAAKLKARTVVATGWSPFTWIG